MKKRYSKLDNVCAGEDIKQMVTPNTMARHMIGRDQITGANDDISLLGFDWLDEMFNTIAVFLSSSEGNSQLRSRATFSESVISF